MISSGCTSEYYVQNSNTNFCTSPYTNQCISSYLSQNTNLYMNPCISQGLNNVCVNPCMNQSMCGCMNPCISSNMSQCMKCCCCCNCKCNYPGIGSDPVQGEIDGSKGPFLWHIEYSIDEEDFHKDYFYITVTFLGFKIINTRLDVKNPSIDLNLVISGIGIKTQLGVDFENRNVYLKGRLNFVYYTKDFSIILYEF